jgi:hypothetical protein
LINSALDVTKRQRGAADRCIDIRIKALTKEYIGRIVLDIEELDMEKGSITGI